MSQAYFQNARLGDKVQFIRHGQLMQGQIVARESHFLRVGWSQGKSGPIVFKVYTLDGIEFSALKDGAHPLQTCFYATAPIHISSPGEPVRHEAKFPFWKTFVLGMLLGGWAS
jgi:hypothetical protein